MLRVAIDYVPYGDERRTERIASALIVNDGTGDPESGNYDITFFLRYEPGGAAPDPDAIWRKVRVEDFPREVLSPWHLLRRALTAALDEE